MLNGLNYLVPVATVLGLSLACSIIKTENGKEFSKDIFLSAVCIGIAVLVWIPLIPVYSISISILIMVGMFFSKGDNTNE